jgi:hypothetical protein
VTKHLSFFEWLWMKIRHLFRSWMRPRLRM